MEANAQEKAAAAVGDWFKKLVCSTIGFGVGIATAFGVFLCAVAGAKEVAEQGGGYLYVLVWLAALSSIWGASGMAVAITNRLLKLVDWTLSLKRK